MTDPVVVTVAQNLQKALTYVKTILSIDDESEDWLLSLLIKSANAMVCKKTSLDLLNVSEVVEYFSWAGTRQLFLSHTPVATVSKIERNNTRRSTPSRETVVATDYIVEDFWQVTFAFNIYRGHKNIRATYTTGFTDFDTIPAQYEDLKLALALITGNMYNIRKQGGIASEWVSGTNLVYDKKAMTKDVDQLLDQYLDIAI